LSWAQTKIHRLDDPVAITGWIGSGQTSFLAVPLATHGLPLSAKLAVIKVRIIPVAGNLALYFRRPGSSAAADNPTLFMEDALAAGRMTAPPFLIPVFNGDTEAQWSTSWTVAANLAYLIGWVPEN
jgi:hypothetical protein